MCLTCTPSREHLAMTTMGKRRRKLFVFLSIIYIQICIDTDCHTFCMLNHANISNILSRNKLYSIQFLYFSFFFYFLYSYVCACLAFPWLDSYCDVFQKCREVDPSGPLATLRKLLLSEESIATFKKWMQQNWYTVALAGLGVLVLLVSNEA